MGSGPQRFPDLHPGHDLRQAELEALDLGRGLDGPVGGQQAGAAIDDAHGLDALLLQRHVVDVLPERAVPELPEMVNVLHDIGHLEDQVLGEEDRDVARAHGAHLQAAGAHRLEDVPLSAHGAEGMDEDFDLALGALFDQLLELFLALVDRGAGAEG